MYDEFIERVETLSFDILTCLQADLPVNVYQEMELMKLIDDADEPIGIDLTPSLQGLAEFLLDYDGDQAWNIKNMLVGSPVL